MKNVHDLNDDEWQDLIARVSDLCVRYECDVVSLGLFMYRKHCDLRKKILDQIGIMDEDYSTGFSHDALGYANDLRRILKEDGCND